MQRAVPPPARPIAPSISLLRVVDAHVNSFVEQFMKNNRLFNCGRAIEMQALNLCNDSTVRRVKIKGSLLQRKR